MTGRFCTHFTAFGGGVAPFSVAIQDPGATIGPAPDDPSTVLQIVTPPGTQVVLRGPPLVVPNLRSFCFCTRFRVAEGSSVRIGVAATQPPLPCEHVVAIDVDPAVFRLLTEVCDGSGSSSLSNPDGALDAAFHDFQVCGGPDPANPGGVRVEASVDGAPFAVQTTGMLFVPLRPQIGVFGFGGTTDLRIDSYCLRFVPP